MKKILLAAFFLSSCASFRPVLNDNEHYKQVGDQKAERDIDSCIASADVYLEKHKAERLKNQVGRQALGGAIVGGIIGAITGDTRNALAGAAAGGVVGAGGAYVDEKSKDNIKPDELKQAYVAKCLQSKNYEILGWK